MNTPTTCITSLPRDILLEILTRLPPKSVVRFRCISKFFNSFIPEPHLAFRILVSIPSTTRRILNLYTMSYTEESQGKLQANSVQHLDVQRFQGWVDSSFAEGKICLFSRFGEAALCDLNTTQHISLLRICRRRNNNNQETMSTRAVLGFDSVSKRYKVFNSELYYDYDSKQTLSRQWVLTLEVDESWRKINYIIPSYPDDGVHIDGIIYLIHWKAKSNIVAFDVGTENFVLIPFPCDQFQSYFLQPQHSAWVNLNNRLALIHNHTEDLRSKIDIWTLEKSMEWEKHLVPLPLEVSQVIGQASSRGITTNSMGEIVFWIQARSSMSPLILLYAFRRQVWRKFEICGLHDYLYISRGLMRSPAVHFIEESVSFLE